MPDIFDEVQEDLRAERAKNLFRRYGALMIGVLLLFVAGVGGWQLWRWRQQQQAMAAADIMLAAMRQADALPPLPAAAPAGAREAAIAGFGKINSPDSYRTLARLREAALQADRNDLAAADALWDQVAQDGSADPLLRDLASLLWVERQPDDAAAGPLLARLKPLTSPDNAWHALALEQQALIEMRSDAADAARDTLRQLAADVTVPEGVRNRASGLLSKLGGST